MPLAVNTLYRRVRLNTNSFRHGGNKSTFEIEGFAFVTKLYIKKYVLLDTIIMGVVDNRNPVAAMQILQNAATDMQMMQVQKNIEYTQMKHL